MSDEDEPVCGESYDHDEQITYDGPDGVQWVCRECGAEGFEDPDTLSPISQLID